MNDKTQQQQIVERRKNVVAQLQESAADMRRALDIAEAELGAKPECIAYARAKVENAVLWADRAFSDAS